MSHYFGHYGTIPYTYPGQESGQEKSVTLDYDAIMRAQSMPELLGELGLPEDIAGANVLSLADPNILKRTQFSNPMYRDMLTDLSSQYKIQKQLGVQGQDAGRDSTIISNKRTRDMLKRAGSSSYSSNIQDTINQIGGYMGQAHGEGLDYLYNLMQDFYSMDYSGQQEAPLGEEIAPGIEEDPVPTPGTQYVDPFGGGVSGDFGINPCSISPRCCNTEGTLWDTYACGQPGSGDDGGIDDTTGGFDMGLPGSSDIRLKENIELVGKSPLGINIYEFDYKNKNGRYKGVMADELDIGNGAVLIGTDGYLKVDYSKIDVDFEQIN